MNHNFIRELHIDGQVIPDEVRERLYLLGFEEDGFTAAGGGLELPPEHLTWQISGSNEYTKAQHMKMLNKTKEVLLDRTSGFEGYLESEVIPPDAQIEYPFKEYDIGKKLPLSSLRMEHSKKNKVADLHIKIPKSLLCDRLIADFSRVGIYYVETPKGNRIYTIQFLSQRDAKATFHFLDSFFKLSGGCVELTYEICDYFQRVPEGISAPQVVPSGSIIDKFYAQEF